MRENFMVNLITTMLKAMVKGKLGIGKLNGLERFMLSQFTIPDRMPTMIAATNIEPFDIDPSYNWKMTVENVEANVELADKVCNMFDCERFTGFQFHNQFFLKQNIGKIIRQYCSIFIKDF